MVSSPIGIFDSGIGGLSVVIEIKKLLPKESIIFLADKKNFPYGDKTTKQIDKFSKTNVNWLISQGAKLIVVACNTATVSSISYLRKTFPNVTIIGMEPAIKPAGKISKKGIIILSSPMTRKNKQVGILMEKYAKGKKTFNVGSSELVEAVENEWSPDDVKKVLDNALPRKLLRQVDTIVLGCSHFPLIKNQIQEHVGKNIHIVDSGEAIARRVERLLIKNNLLKSRPNPSYKFYTTGKNEKVRNIKFIQQDE